MKNTVLQEGSGVAPLEKTKLHGLIRCFKGDTVKGRFFWKLVHRACFLLLTGDQRI